MSFSKRFLANCAIPLPESQSNQSLQTLTPIKFLPGELIQRIILFEEYILESIRLSEIPHMVSIFGVEQVIELLNSGALKIYSDSFMGHGSTGKTSGIFESRRKKGDLPPGSYCIDALRIYPFDPSEKIIYDYKRNYNKYQIAFIHHDLEQLNDIPKISSKQSKQLKRAVAQCIKQLSSASVSDEITDTSYSDFRNHDPTIRIAIANNLRKLHGLNIDPSLIKLEITFLDDVDFRVESNLKDLTDLDIGAIHKIIERALLGITNLNYKIAKMKDLDTLIGYKNEEEALIFSDRLDFILRKVADPNKLTANFSSVVSAKGLPDFELAAMAGEIDLIKIISIRESKECVEFRNWLWVQREIDEKELKDALESFSQLFKDLRSTKAGKLICLMTLSGMGGLISSSLPDTDFIASLGLGLLDEFIIEKILPSNGPITFINNQLTSIYTEPYFLYKAKKG